MTPRCRQIRWDSEGKHYTALEVCVSKIVMGFDNGKIDVYNSANLKRQTVLNSPYVQSRDVAREAGPRINPTRPVPAGTGRPVAALTYLRAGNGLPVNTDFRAAGPRQNFYGPRAPVEARMSTFIY